MPKEKLSKSGLPFPESLEEKNYPHYYKKVTHLNTIDVYRVIDLFEITHPCIQHALKKLMVAGKRGAKDSAKDIQEAIDSLCRYQEMEDEDEQA